ncbi:MAG: YciI family protein [Mycobacteriales bacterium]
MKFALVIVENEASRRSIEVDRTTHRKQIETWMAKHAQSGTLIGGEAFETEKLAPVTVRRDDDGTLSVTEVGFAGDVETLGGYILVDVLNREAAVELAKSWPMAEAIEVRPIWEPSSSLN